MKTSIICSGVVLGALIFLGLGSIVAGAQTVAPADEITIDGKKPARFNHQVHTGMGLSCAVCHHDKDHNPLTPEAIGAITDTKVLNCVSCHNSEFPRQELQKAKDVFHARCKTCHQEGYQGKKGPGKCSDCHIKKKKGYEGC